MIEIRDCDNYEAAKELILEYSKIKGAEACFVSLNKELAFLRYSSVMFMNIFSDFL